MTFKYLAGLAANLVTGATITASSEDANYDADNVGVGWPAQPFRFNAAAANDTLDFDFGSAVAPTLIGVIGHNIDSGITSITVLSDDNSGFTSPVTEATITSPASPTFYEILSAPTSHRYWRLKFNGTNTAAPIEIGEVVMGVAVSAPRAQLLEWSYEEEMPQNRQDGGNIRQAFAVSLSDHRQRHVTLSFYADSYSERNTVRSWLTGTGFGEEPFIFVPDEGDEFVIHGRMPRSIVWERIPGGAGRHKTTFTIEEDPFSLTLP